MSETNRREAAVPVASIEVGDRLLKPDMRLIDELTKDIAERGLLQRVGVRERADGKHDLAWGRHRLEAAGKLGWTSIPAVVYPPDTADHDLAVLERVENYLRRELSTEERDLHRAELAALLQEQQAGETVNRLTVSGRGGRGKRGIKSRVAEAEGVTKQAIKKTEERIAEAVGEPVDFERDPPAETRRKAHEAAKAGKPAARARELRNTQRRLVRQFGQVAKPTATSPKPKRLDDLLLMMRELDAGWPEQLDVGALPSVQRKGLAEAVQRLRRRLDDLEATLGVASAMT